MILNALLLGAQLSAHLGSQWLASTDSDGGSAMLLLAGPIAGGVIYLMLFRYYRNTDKSHAFEQETTIASQPVTGGDAKVEEVRGTTRQRINNGNEGSHRTRVQRVQ